MQELLKPRLSPTYLLEQQYWTDPSVFIPDRNTANTILFLGQDSYPGLKSGVEETLRAYGMLTPNVAGLLNFMEGAYGDSVRRTGEKSFAHVLRAVANTAELINNLNLAYFKNRPYIKGESKPIDKNYLAPLVQLKPAIVELTLLTAILHDFGEKEDPSDPYSTLGYIESKIIYPPDIKSPLSGVYVTLWDKSANLPQPGRSFRIDMEQSYMTYLNDALDALDIANLKGSATTEKLWAVGDNILRFHTTMDPELYTFYYLVRMADRFDNLATFSFILPKDLRQSPIERIDDSRLSKYHPAELEKILSKIKETEEAYMRVERLLENIASPALPQTFIELFTLRKVLYDRTGIYLNFNLAKNNPILRGIKPTLWTKLTSLGFGPNSIFLPQPATSGKLVFPRMKIVEIY